MDVCRYLALGPTLVPSPTEENEIEGIKGLPDIILSIISSYSLVEDYVKLSILSTRIRHLGDHLSGGEPIWTTLYKRDFSHSFDQVIARLRKPAKLLGPQHLSQVYAQLYRARMISSATYSTHVLDGHTAEVNSLTQLRDGRIASVSDDRTIRIWSLEGGEPRILQGHTAAVLSLIELGDGRIASASFDQTIRIWSLEGGEPRVLQGHTDPVRSLIQLGDGRIASASYDRTIRIWDIDGGSLVRAAVQLARQRLDVLQGERTPPAVPTLPALLTRPRRRVSRDESRRQLLFVALAMVVMGVVLKLFILREGHN